MGELTICLGQEQSSGRLVQDDPQPQPEAEAG